MKQGGGLKERNEGMKKWEIKREKGKYEEEGELKEKSKVMKEWCC